tara:strand:- start:670 stop:2496 length:1827 start_codon:yes stop_codon:yes gene_type:complete
MANGTRSIYSREQAMRPGQYDTSLADFLSRLPDYYAQLEGVKLAREKQELAETRYQDAREREKIKYEDSLIQQDFENHMKIYNSLDKASHKQQYLQKFLQDPKFKNFNVTALNDATSNSVNLENAYDDIISRYQDIAVTPFKNQFSRYEDINKVFTEMEGMLSDYRGTEYEKDLSSKYKELSTLKATLLEKSGQIIPLDDADFSVKSKYKSLNKLRENAGTAFREAEASLYEIADYDRTSKTHKLISGWRDNQIMQQDLQKRTRSYNLAKKNLDEVDKRLSSFIEDNNLRYPEVATAKKREAGEAMNKEMTDWFSENQAYMLSKAGEDGMFAEMLYDDLSGLSSTERYEKYQTLKDIVNQEKEFDQIVAEFDEGEGQDTVVADNQVVDDREPYEKGAMEGATEMETGVEITDQDVDDILASVRETTGFYPEGNAPRMEDKKEIEPSPETPTLPPVVEQAQARDGRFVDRVIERRKEQARGAELFPKTEAVTIDSLRNTSLKDAKGNKVDFNNAMEYNTQINGMFKKIQNINKQIRQSGGRLSREQRLSKLQEARQVLSNLTQALMAKDIQSPKSVRDKNIKSTAASFLKRKKFSTISDLEQYFNNLLQ